LRLKVLEESARETLARRGHDDRGRRLDDPHQANVRILDATARKLGLPAKKLVVTVSIITATLRLRRCRSRSTSSCAPERSAPGARAAAGSGRGFTWGSSLVTL